VAITLNMSHCTLYPFYIEELSSSNYCKARRISVRPASTLRSELVLADQCTTWESGLCEEAKGSRE
jgi:hypothetical protein